MTEDEKEDMIYRLWDEAREVLGSAANDEKKYAFIMGARAALYEIGHKTEPQS